MKLAIVGGGSTYTPELIDGFTRYRDVLPLEEIALVDPDPRRLELGLGQCPSQPPLDRIGLRGSHSPQLCRHAR